MMSGACCALQSQRPECPSTWRGYVRGRQIYEVIARPRPIQKWVILPPFLSPPSTLPPNQPSRSDTQPADPRPQTPHQTSDSQGPDIRHTRPPSSIPHPIQRPMRHTHGPCRTCLPNLSAALWTWEWILLANRSICSQEPQNSRAGPRSDMDTSLHGSSIRIRIWTSLSWTTMSSTIQCHDEVSLRSGISYFGIFSSLKTSCVGESSGSETF